MGSGKASAVSSSKKVLFEDSASEGDGGATLTINKDYAQRYEYQNKLKERHQLEEKFKREGRDLDNLDESSEQSSDDETEDEAGFLATEALDAEISATLNAIRRKDPRIYDKDAKFYSEKTETEDQGPKEKPLYLKDYHREQYLKGAIEAPDAQDENVPMTYTEEQDALKKSIVSSIKAAGNDADSSESEDEDGTFLKRKTPKEAKLTADGVHPDRQVTTKPTITESDIANADKNPEAFLDTFIASRAWAEGPDGSKWDAFDSDDDGGALETAEQFEHAYNMRFEDPTKSNEVLQTYSRVLTNEKSLRKEENNARKRAREAEKERREAEKRQRREERARLKKLKLEEMQHKLDMIRKTAGAWGKELTEEELLKFLNDTYEDDKWEEEMTKRFGEDYYLQEDKDLGSDDDEEVLDEETGKKSKKPKKPTWDDDIDISNIVGESAGPAREFTVADLEDSDEEPIPNALSASDSEEDTVRPSKKRKTSKYLKKDRLAAKKASKTERAKISSIIDMHLDLADPDALALPSRRKKHRETSAFRYRETSPNSFGLTARDVLLAPSDTALKKFASIKKYAEWRLPEQKAEDSRRLGKKARLRKWRKEVFGKDFEKSGPTYGFGELFKAEAAKAKEWGRGRDSEDEVKVRKEDVKKEDGEGKKKKRRSKKKGSKVAVEE